MVGKELPKDMYYDIDIGLCQTQHGMTAACWQGLSTAPVLLQKYV